MGTRLSSVNWSATWYKIRWRVFERDAFTCQSCGQAAPDVKLEVALKTALADGGSNDLSNLVTSCYACNRGKNSLRMEIAGRTKTNGDKRKPTQGNILIALKDGALTPREIAQKLDIKERNARMAISRLSAKGEIVKVGKSWGLAA